MQHAATKDQQAQVLTDIIQRRRAVRRFTQRAIPEEVLQACLDLAMLAPNSSNLQPWAWHVIRDPQLKAEMAKACLNQKAAQTADTLIAVVAKPQSWRSHAQQLLQQWPDPPVPAIVERYYTRTVTFAYDSGLLQLKAYGKKLLVTLMGLARPIIRGPFTRSEMKVWAAKTCALAAENLMLALTAHGFDSCPMEGFDAVRVKRLLRLKRDEFTVMVIAAGEQAEKGVYNTRFRFPREQVVIEH